MSAVDPFAQGLELAAQQLANLAADNFDAYLAALPDYEAACAEVAAAVTNDPQHGASELSSLIELQRQISDRIDASKKQLGRRMSTLQTARRANGAYLAHIAIPQQPIGQA
jgi:ABC-type transporter Mla subunit MlaD